MRLALCWVLIFCLTAPAYGRLDCPTALAQHAGKSPAQISFLQTLESTLNLSQIDESQKQLILKKAAQIQVREQEVEPERIRFKKSLFNPWGILGVAAKRVLIWPSREILEEANPELLSMKMADLTGELLFEVPQNPNIFFQTPTSFFRNNIDAIVAKLYLQYFTLTESGHGDFRSESVTYKILKTVLKTMLPYELAPIRSAKIDGTTAQLFETGGPQAVYSYVRKLYGPSIAMKYWLRHVQNATQALTLTFCLYIAPTIRDTWNLMTQESTVSIPNVDRKLATDILQDLKKTDVELIDSLKTQSENKEEQKALLDFEKVYGEKDVPKKP